MHRLQQHIIHQLILHPSLRYARLKPDAVEGNLFMYHLRQLIKEGLVTKRSDGQYELSPEGKLYADRLSLKSFTPRAQPKIVTLISCQNQHGEWLLYERKRQPLIGQIGFPYGKIHLGETIQTAAERELQEKTGLTATLTHRGDGYITSYENGSPVSQIMFHLFEGKNPSGKLKSESDIGRVFWQKINPKTPEPNHLAALPDLLHLLQTTPQTQRFFTELTYGQPKP